MNGKNELPSYYYEGIDQDGNCIVITKYNDPEMFAFLDACFSEHEEKDEAA
jgi:hypothetical protein